MKHTFQYLLAILLISILFSTCCKEECDDPTDSHCSNYDPCLSVVTADASFMAFDSIIPTWADTSVGFPIDAFRTGQTVYFKALHKDMLSYEWKVGTDTRVWTAPEFSLGFDGFEGEVSVRLITTAKDDLNCLSEEELRDTSYRSYEVTSYGPFEVPVFGVYKGTDTASPNHEYTLTLLGEGEDIWHSSRLFDLPVDCDYPIGLRFYGFQRWFVSVHDNIHCRNTIVIGRLQDDNNTLIADYWYDDDAGKRQHYVFEGVRQ